MMIQIRKIGVQQKELATNVTWRRIHERANGSMEEYMIDILLRAETFFSWHYKGDIHDPNQSQTIRSDVFHPGIHSGDPKSHRIYGPNEFCFF